jgi:hypothetical protein
MILLFIYLYSCRIWASRDSSVNIETGYRLDGQGLIFSRDKRYICTPQCPDQLWSPCSFLRNGYQGVSPGNLPEHEADHSPPASAEVKNCWATPPLPHTSWSHVR